MEATLSFLYGDRGTILFRFCKTVTPVSSCDLGTHSMQHQDHDSARVRRFLTHDAYIVYKGPTQNIIDPQG